MLKFRSLAAREDRIALDTMSFQFDPTFLLTTAGGGLGLAESGR